ncbi:disease resistance protein RUN1-like [Macadamia integrifolia]|uniref:disease resistance protein RUN1-like n=1 Tax=Macadamia integrifolia TaxID=60698 RepID=UPI001C5011C3|nr:disease resistance protein RUN1-like [Macadamia integrifolia]
MAAHDGASSSSSSSSIPNTFDVFLSFRGEDTRNNFTVFLHKALITEGINAFMDSENLWGGEEIGPAVLQAIGRSKISIPIFSIGYADSKWCLLELAEIVQCHKSEGQIILPIFFDVDPTDVRHQTKSFIQSFKNHKDKFDDRTIEGWKKAMTMATERTGYELKQVNGNLLKLVDKVVDRALSELDCGRMGDIKYPIGLHDHVENLSLLLNAGSNDDVQFVGICGIGGIGKTTIAKAFYNNNYNRFISSCFLANIREEASGLKGLVPLQEQLLHIVSKKRVNGQVWNVHRGQQLIKERLQVENVLLILDDVDCISQLNALAIESNSFGRGSIIIITCRDEHILKVAKVDEGKIYWPKELDTNRSLQLFSLHAFSSDQPPEDYKQLSNDVLHLAGGLPLTLEVLGSYLCDIREKDVWQSVLRKLKRIPNNAVNKKLKISYDSLEDDEKSIFLDAACFFIGWRKEILISLWEACGFEPISTIKKLTQRSLLKFIANLRNSYDELRMHDQIQAMGRSIIYEENLMEPGKRSRLWHHDEILDVLKEHKETQSIEGILPPSNKLCWNVCLHMKDFEMMSKIRFLYLNGAHLEGDFPHLPSSLSWFSWWRCPSEIIPDISYLKRLVYMNLSNSRIRQAWTNNPQDEGQCFQKLKVLRLRFCDHLSVSPDFSWFPHLETLDLGCCKNMVNLHQTIGDLKSLVKLYLDDTEIEELPNSICQLTNLQFLNLSSCSSLQNLPKSIGDLRSLVTLSLDGTKIQELPNSICGLSSLQSLTLVCCKSLKKLPESIGDLKSLVTFSLDWTQIEELPSSICRLSSLQYLTLNWCSSLENLPESIDNLKSLVEFSIHGTKIKKLPIGVGLLEKLESSYIGWKSKNI